MKYLLPTSFNPKNKKHLSRLHAALAQLVRPDLNGVDEPTIGKATRDAIKAAKKRFKMRVTGRPNRAFLYALDEELLVRRWSRPAQVKKLHRLIMSAARAEGISIDLGADARTRTVTADTRRAISVLETHAGRGSNDSPTVAAVRTIATTAAEGRRRAPSYLLGPNFDSSDPKQVGRFQRALKDLATPEFTTAITPEVKKVKADEIRRIQGRFGLQRTGKLDDATIVAIKTTEEIKKTQIRLDTRSKNGILNKSTIDALNQEIIDRRFSTKTQAKELHTKLRIAARNAGLGRIDLGADLKARSIGEPTKRAILACQKKYGLKDTGILNVETIEMIESLVASRAKPRRHMLKPLAEELALVRGPLRLNMRRSSVRDVQKALAWSGHAILEREFNTGRFGKTTRDALIDFQRANRLPGTGEIDAATRRALNDGISRANPTARAADEGVYRVRGSVRDIRWKGKKEVTVKVFEKSLRGLAPLGERKSFKNGYFDVAYEAPRGSDGAVKNHVHIVVKIAPSTGSAVERAYHNVGRVHWANFTDGKQAYRGDSRFTLLEHGLTASLGGGVTLGTLEESNVAQDVTYLSANTGADADDVMKVSLAHRVGNNTGGAALTPEVFYAFLSQNYPPELPADLQPDTPGEWQPWVDDAVETAALGIAFLEREVQERVLDDALAANLVSRDILLNKKAILTEFDTLRQDFVLEKPILDGRGKFKSLLDRAKVPQQFHRPIADVFVAHWCVGEKFWDEVGKIGGVAVADLKQVADLGRFTANQPDTIQQLLDRIADVNEPEKKPQDFAKWTLNQWKNIVERDHVPEGTPGSTQTQRRNAFAAEIKHRSEQLFPAVALMAQVKDVAGHGLQYLAELTQIIDDHPEIDLSETNLDRFNADPTHATTPLSDNELSELKLIQRVHRLAPETRTATKLLKAKLHSAVQVYSYGRDRLAKKLGVDDSDAKVIWERARYRHAKVLALLGKYRMELQQGTPRAMQFFSYTPQELSDAAGDIPNLETLFGSVDYCDCAHCQSVYSPAAYLADLLRFLGEKDAVTAANARVVLLERRPDIQNIKLSCQNTETPVPYVDLACEILENWIVSGSTDAQYQTTLSADRLKAISEYVDPAAYELLRDADYPMVGPLNLWQEEARVFLQHLGVPRHELMYAFQNRSETDEEKHAPRMLSIAGEYFGIPTHGLSLVVDQKAGKKSKQNAIWDIEDSDASSQPVATLIDRAQFHPDDGYYEFRELLQCRFVNPVASKSELVNFEACDVGEQRVDRMGFRKLDRMHRFIRLWHAVDWEMWELDRLIRSPGIGDQKIDRSCLQNLYRVAKLAAKLRLNAEDLSVFYGPLSIEARTAVRASEDMTVPSHFDRLFQNVAITNPINPDLASGSLVGDIKDQRATVQAALFLTEKDLDKLLQLTNGKLTLDNLSTLFRHAVLARAMGLSIEDLGRLSSVTGINDPFSTPEATLRLLEYHEDIKEFDTGLRSLEYALSGNPESPMGVRDETLKQWAQGLRATLAGIRQADATNGEERGSRTRVQPTLQALRDIEVIPAASDIEKMLDLVEGIWTDSGTDSESERLAFIEEHFGPFVRDLLAVQALLTKDSGLDDDGKAARFEAVIAELRAFRVLNSVREHASAIIGLDAEKAAVIIEKVKTPASGTKIVDVLRDPGLTDTDAVGGFITSIDSAGMPDLFASYRLLHRISTIFTGVEVKTEDLSWFIDNHASAGTLNLNGLPSGGSGSLPFNEWRDLRRHLAFIECFPEPEDVSFRQVLSEAAAGVALPQFRTSLSKLTEWRTTDLAASHSDLGFSDPGPTSDYLKAETYARLSRCFSQMHRTGVDAASMVRWAKRDAVAVEKKVAREAREAAKSKYNEARWLEVAGVLQDDIREKKRAALVAYAVEHSQRSELKTVDDGSGNEIPNPLFWRKPDDIHRYLLIDGLMSACQPTSRIKLAMSSVQLFIQRCLDGLEERYVRPADQGGADRANSWKQWRWMKSYRIWEANRKVFLYPENWIEPELRDDKTPFFKELEDELLGGDITEEAVEAAFRSYLEKVEEVAHLEICGLYHETSTELDQMHVVGRTRNVPSVYYHRCFDLFSSTWSPWEKIEIEIEGDHVTPVVYNRKLHLFWLSFEEKPLKLKMLPPVQASGTPQPAPDSLAMLQVRLGWTVKTHKGWSSKRIAKQKLINPWKRPEHSYNLRPRYKSLDNSLWLDVFISTSKAFNDTKFYDQYKGERVPLTDVPFDETFRPWHAASFVFDGDLIGMRLRGLAGKYFLPEEKDQIDTNSYEFVRQNFEEESGGRINRLRPHQRSLALPAGMHFENRHLTNNRFHAKNDEHFAVLDKGVSRGVLRNAPKPFQLVETQQDMQLGSSSRPFVYQDRHRAFLVRPEFRHVFVDCRTRWNRRAYEFNPLYHPYAGLFVRELNRGGLDGLLRRDLQKNPESFFPKSSFNFAHYKPVDLTSATASGQKEVVDFDLSGAYSVYNWEIFFHAPLMIASMLNKNQKFEASMKWFHYIFDPTSTETGPIPQRYWITKPFYENNAADYKTQRVRNILEQIGAFDDAVTAWKNDPFKPHLVARYRPVAYQRAVVMRYIDNLIDWGDQLFRRDSIESINEATLRYLLAQEILGDRPTRVPSMQRQSHSFAELEANQLDDFANTQVAVLAEHLAQPPVRFPVEAGEEDEPLPILSTLYFCIPQNDRLDEYWDRVADRLFKIRNCMNIEGVVRQLPLFEPPIDPALLVKAAAAGVDFTSVLDDLSAPLPPYRFEVMVQQARRLVGEVRSLGSLLLAALEKEDAEELAVLRADHQEDLLKATKSIRQMQIRESTQQLQGLTENRALVEQRREFYASREYMNPWEITATALEGTSVLSHTAATVIDMISGALALVPNFTTGAAGVGGTAVVTGEQGGQGMSKAQERQGGALYQIAAILSKLGGMAATQGGYQRRMEDWDFQAQQARQELRSMDRQVAAAEIRIAIAERELENLELQIVQASSEHEYLRTKYTNRQLYSWMLGRLSSLYFQSYQLAYDTAKRAERSYQYELGQADSSYIAFGYWDGLKKGLLAGERLSQSLDRLEAAYRDQNRREYEITKRISLAEVAPLQLLELKYTGECTLDLPEWFFDIDYPGHYMRRVKSASVTVPGVVGPYTSLNCTVSIESSEVRVDNTLLGGKYERDTQGTDRRFRDQVVAVPSMVTSHGQGDTGLFELRLADERYLPFECAGAIGRWKIRMPIEDNQFDFGSIMDFVLTLQYTAREGGKSLRDAAVAHRDTIVPKSGETMLSLRHHFSTEWHRFLHPAQTGDEQVLELKLGPEHFPFFVRGRQPKATSLQLAFESSHAGDYKMQVKLPGQAARGLTMKRSGAELGDLHVPTQAVGFPQKPVAYGEWDVKLRRDGVADFASLASGEIEDFFILIKFEL